MPHRRSLLRLLPLLALPLMTAGCIVHTHPVPDRVIVGGPPVVVVQPVVHRHGPFCGHRSRWYNGRRVYWVGHRWEYIQGGRLYVYHSVPPGQVRRHGTKVRPVPETRRAPVKTAPQVRQRAPEIRRQAPDRSPSRRAPDTARSPAPRRPKPKADR